MIARENLEKRRDALLVRSGALAIEKIDHEARLRVIDEEARQIGVLFKVFDTTLADLGADEAESDKRIKELEKALAATDEGNMNEDGGTESI